MDFRRSAQLDDRRRRVLMEEVAAPAEAEEPTIAPAGKRSAATAYSQSALTDLQWRVSDLVPIRPFLVAAIVLALMTGVAAIETIYICWQTSPPLPRSSPLASLDRGQLAAIDLAARGNLASWYSSLLLAAGGCGALIIFSIRCHRVDDYRGRYRVWLWTAAGLVWASLDSATGSHQAIGAIIGQLGGSPGLADMCWLALYLLVFGALAIRMGIETWHAVGSFSTLSVAATLYLMAGMTAVGWIPLPGYLLATVLETTQVMLAHVVLLMGLMLYARHVHLDAQGKLPLRIRTQAPKPKRKPKARLAVVSGDDDKEEESRQAAAKGSAPAVTPVTGGTSGAQGTGTASNVAAARPGPLATKVAASISRDDEDDDAEDDRSDDGEPLSKSERRRLKKMARQQRRAA